MNKEFSPERQILAAVRSRETFDLALASTPSTVFLLAGSILRLPYYISAAASAGKRLFLHIDMIDGLGRDASAVEFVAKLAPFGIISTRGNIIKQAKSLGLCTVQRFFIVDGQSVKTAADTLQQTKPDYAELMPGLTYKAIHEFARQGYPVIAGGLIGTRREVLDAFAAGACAVSTSKTDLWDMAL